MKQPLTIGFIGLGLIGGSELNVLYGIDRCRIITE